jgi:hypothetical protein
MPMNLPEESYNYGETVKYHYYTDTKNSCYIAAAFVLENFFFVDRSCFFLATVYAHFSFFLHTLNSIQSSIELRATSYELQATSNEQRATSYELRATSYELRATSYGVRATSYELGDMN